MAQGERVAGVKTRQGRDISDFVNRASLPRAFLGMLHGEDSALDERSWRDRRDLARCDVSGNLPHISICTALDVGLVPGFGRGSDVTDASVAAYRALCADPGGTLVLLGYATTLFETQCAGPARDAQGWLSLREGDRDLLAACLWNAPNAPGSAEPALVRLANSLPGGWASRAVREYVARFWLDPDLPQRSPKYSGRRDNYLRGLVAAQAFVVVEEPMANPWQKPEWQYEVGEGVGYAMQARDDEPRGPEIYFPDGITSLTPGAKWLYTYSKLSNITYVSPKA